MHLLQCQISSVRHTHPNCLWPFLFFRVLCHRLNVVCKSLSHHKKDMTLNFNRSCDKLPRYVNVYQKRILSGNCKIPRKGLIPIFSIFYP